MKFVLTILYLISTSVLAEQLNLRCLNNDIKNKEVYISFDSDSFLSLDKDKDFAVAEVSHNGSKRDVLIYKTKTKYKVQKNIRKPEKKWFGEDIRGISEYYVIDRTNLDFYITNYDKKISEIGSCEVLKIEKIKTII